MSSPLNGNKRIQKKEQSKSVGIISRIEGEKVDREFQKKTAGVVGRKNGKGGKRWLG